MYTPYGSASTFAGQPGSARQLTPEEQGMNTLIDHYRARGDTPEFRNLAASFGVDPAAAAAESNKRASEYAQATSGSRFRKNALKKLAIGALVGMTAGAASGAFGAAGAAAGGAGGGLGAGGAGGLAAGGGLSAVPGAAGLGANAAAIGGGLGGAGAGGLSAAGASSGAGTAAGTAAGGSRMANAFSSIFGGGGGKMGLPGWLSFGSNVLGSIMDQRQQRDIAGQLTTNLGQHGFSGPGGLEAFAGEEGTGFDLGMLNDAFLGQGDLAGGATGMANAALRGGIPSNIANLGSLLDNQDLDLGTLLAGQFGGNAMAAKSLADAFGGGFDPEAIGAAQLEKMRAAARPQEQRATQDFMQNLYSTGRGAVTGAVGNEGSIGGGRLAAAFGQGLGEADLQRQVLAQEQGINAANASEGLLKSAFGRFMDTSQFASENNNAIFNRQRGVLNDAYGRAVSQATMPAGIAGAFQNLAQGGIGQGIDLGRFGIDLSTSAYNTGMGAGQLRIGSGGNLASYMGNRTASPVLDTLGSFFQGQVRPGQTMSNPFANLFSRNRGSVPGVTGPQPMDDYSLYD